MASDHIQRQMDFIVEQQAKFAVDIAKLEERTKENTASIAKLGEIILSLANYNEHQDEQIAAHDRQIAGLIEAGKETDRRFKETDERFRETDERLNALIILAERFFNRNGQQPSDE